MPASPLQPQTQVPPSPQLEVPVLCDLTHESADAGPAPQSPDESLQYSSAAQLAVPQVAIDVEVVAMDVEVEVAMDVEVEVAMEVEVEVAMDVEVEVAMDVEVEVAMEVEVEVAMDVEVEVAISVPVEPTGPPLFWVLVLLLVDEAPPCPTGAMVEVLLAPEPPVPLEEPMICVLPHPKTRKDTAPNAIESFTMKPLLLMDRRGVKVWMTARPNSYDRRPLFRDR